MNSTTLMVWAAGVGLQIVLLFLLFHRRLARRLPIFTLLIAFYVARAVALFALFGHISRAAYLSLYTNSSLADIALQILVAAEIAWSFLRTGRPVTGRRLTVQACIILVSIAAAGLIAWELRVRGPLPIDRGALFASLLMIFLFLWAALGRYKGLVRRLVEGFALYAAVSTAATMVRSYAALHRQAGLYVAGSYSQSGIYIVAVLFWILTLRSRSTSAAPVEVAA